MAHIQKNSNGQAALSGWSLASALGLLAAAFVWDRFAPPEDQPAPSRPSSDRAGAASGRQLVSEDRGRQAASPAEALAAGMTYYSILQREIRTLTNAD